MSEQINDQKTNTVKNTASSSKGKFVAVLAVVAVACSFSYVAGMQQSGRVETMVNPMQFGTNTPSDQSLNQEPTSNSVPNQSGIEDNQQTYGYNQQVQPQSESPAEDPGFSRHEGRHGGHGGRQIAENKSFTSQQNYSATPQRCCATGKTGSCHAW